MIIVSHISDAKNINIGNKHLHYQLLWILVYNLLQYLTVISKPKRDKYSKILWANDTIIWQNNPRPVLLFKNTKFDF